MEAVAVTGITATIQVAVAYCMLQRHRKEYSPALTAASVEESYPRFLFHTAVFNAALYASSLVLSTYLQALPFGEQWGL